MSNDYVFKFTDPDKSAESFVVKPYTVDGHLTPANPAFYTNPDVGVTAVSANTSLVLIGKGMPDYGEAVQNNLVYMLEHFANDTAPLEPVQGQVWYNNAAGSNLLHTYSGTVWDRILIETSTGLTSDVNVGGHTLTNVNNPTNQQDAATKNYTDATLTAHATDTTLHLSIDQNTFLDALSLPTLTAIEVNQLIGINTGTPIQTQINSKLNLSGGSMTGALILSADPTTSFEAATKQYVDAAVIAGGADGVVNSGSLNPSTGVLTLGRTVGAPVIVSGTFAPSVHTQNDTTVTRDIVPPISQSFVVDQSIAGGTYPTPSVRDVLTYIDQAVYDLQRPVRRQIIVSTGVASVTLNSNMGFVVNSNKLQIFVNGVKQYASERGHSVISLYNTGVGLTSDTGLALSTLYAFNITVDGVGPTSLSVTTPGVGPYTYSQLISDIKQSLILAAIPASVGLNQYKDKMDIVFVSNASGTGSSIVVSYGIGSLFESISTTLTIPPTNISITTTYAYGEVGLAGETSQDVVFSAAPAIGSVIEVLVLS